MSQELRTCGVANAHSASIVPSQMMPYDSRSSAGRFDVHAVLLLGITVQGLFISSIFHRRSCRRTVASQFRVLTWNDRCNLRFPRGDEQVAEGGKPGERASAGREGG